MAHEILSVRMGPMNLTRRRGIRNPRNSRSRSWRPRDSIRHRHHRERQTCHACNRAESAISRVGPAGIHRCVHRFSDALHSVPIGSVRRPLSFAGSQQLQRWKYATFTSFGWFGLLALVVGFLWLACNLFKIGRSVCHKKGCEQL
jgi:hypothetical protein